MRNLADCPCKCSVEGRDFVCELHERNTQQLTIRGHTAFGLYRLDHPEVEWPQDEKRPDAVVVTPTAIVFVEWKGRIRFDSSGGANHDRGFQQLESGIRHFAPSFRLGEERGHGDEHHDRWSCGEDSMPLPSMPPKDHPVAGLLLVGRAGSRIPSEFRAVMGKKVFFGMQKLQSQGYNRFEITLEDLLITAGCPVSDG